MFKFADTQILATLDTGRGAYVLAHSGDCEARYQQGYSVRFYSEKTTRQISPYMDDSEDNIDFNDIAGALAVVQRWPEEDRAEVEAWLREEVVD